MKPPRLVALAGGWGGFIVEFCVLGLAAADVPFGDDIQGESGAFFGFGGEEFAGEVEALVSGREEEDGQVAFSLRGRCETTDHGVGIIVFDGVCLPYRIFCFTIYIRNNNVKVVARMVKY